jgi:hypothetical protein
MAHVASCRLQRGKSGGVQTAERGPAGQLIPAEGFHEIDENAVVRWQGPVIVHTSCTFFCHCSTRVVLYGSYVRDGRWRGQNASTVKRDVDGGL